MSEKNEGKARSTVYEAPQSVVVELEDSIAIVAKGSYWAGTT